MLSYSQALLAIWPRPIRACNKIDNLASASGDGRNGGSEQRAVLLTADRNRFTATCRRTRTFVSPYSRAYRFGVSCFSAGQSVSCCAAAATDPFTLSLTFVEKSRGRHPCFAEPFLSVCRCRSHQRHCRSSRKTSNSSDGRLCRNHSTLSIHS